MEGLDRRMVTTPEDRFKNGKIRMMVVGNGWVGGMGMKTWHWRRVEG